MPVPPEKHQKDQQFNDDDDDFTFPTPRPPQFLAGARGAFHHAPCSPSPPPVWLHLSSPIRRSFSAADCAASPWRHRISLVSRGGCSPALSDYGAAAAVGVYAAGEEEEEEERMDSLWEDLNDADDLFLDVSRRRSVAGATSSSSKERDRATAAVLDASRSSRRRPPGLVAMMHALKKMFVAHKAKNRVHRDEQSTTPSVSASPLPSPFPSNKKK